MKEYAVIKDAVVVNVIVAEDSFQPSSLDGESYVFLNEDDKPFIGRGYDAKTRTFEGMPPEFIYDPVNNVVLPIEESE